MTFARYCPRCDADVFPTIDGNCADCGVRMPTVPMTNAQVTAGAAALLVEYDAMEAKVSVSAPSLTKAQLRMLQVAASRGRMLGGWQDTELLALQRAGFLISEMLWRATGNTASDCLWIITDAGRAFLSSEGLAR